jgi:nicotinamidase-related amidase
VKAQRPIGSGPINRWMVNVESVDVIGVERSQRPVELAASPQNIRLDLGRSAFIVVDMQNDFCHPEGWLGTIGVDVAPARAAIAPIARLLPLLHSQDIPVVWLNWGNRPDRLNLGPSTHHVYDNAGLGPGLGDALANGAHVLELGSWSAAIVDELAHTADIHVAKYAMSGFWDTPLDSILRNLGVTTLFFAGVNLDQCVLCTLQDASFRGYACVLVEQCCATTSPSFCIESTLYNLRQCFGFVTSDECLASALRSDRVMDAPETTT